MDTRTVIIILGPTAVGKTSVAIDVARHYKTDVISADSRQCFRELKIGVARPSDEQLKLATHHFIATHSIHESVTAATFETYALQKCEDIFSRSRVVVMCGGTGLYIKAFCEGLDKVPPVDPQIRNEISANMEKYGLRWLQEEVRLHDKLFFETGEIRNPQRMMRALEVYKSTGRSIIEFQKGSKVKRPFRIVKLGLELPKAELAKNINQRTDGMIEAGLIEEVRALHAYKDLNALKTVGYREIIDHLENRLSRHEAIDEIKTHTRQYAKRQMTWFRRDGDIAWFRPQSSLLVQFLSQELSDKKSPATGGAHSDYGI